MTSVFLQLLLCLVSGQSMLFVGNSYTFANGGIWLQVKEIYQSLETDTLSVSSVTTGGATFQDHWQNQSLREKIQSGEWNMVVLQEQSCMPVVRPELTYTYGDSLSLLVTESGCEPVFFMTWARKRDPFMLEGLELGYSRMGFANGAVVSPCGIAFDIVRREEPGIDPYASDGAHPSLHGTYLAACVIALSVYDVDFSAGTVWQPSDISMEDGEVLRSIAMAACSEYQQPGEGQE